MRWAIILPLKNREVRKSLFARRTGASLDQVFRTKIEKLPTESEDAPLAKDRPPRHSIMPNNPTRAARGRRF